MGKNLVGRTDKNTRAMQENCPKMTLEISCDDYFVAIWDGDGGHVFDSYIDGLNVDVCYDPTQCYLFEIFSDYKECKYEITMDGKVMKVGTTKHDVFEVGSCNSCPGMQKVYFLTYLDTSDVDYIFHRLGYDAVKGTILDGNVINFCIEANSCNMMESTEGELTFYAHLDIDGSLVDLGELHSTKIFGNCERNCTDTTILIYPNQRDGNLTLSVESDDDKSTIEVLSNGQNKAICIDKSKCSVINAQGKADYYFLHDGSVLDKSSISNYYRYFGPCETKCTNKPDLAETGRGLRILTRLSTISGMDQLADFHSDRYKAACWLIYDDTQQYSEDDPKLIQRYVLSLIYFTTGGETN